ncbi:hypothetical protein IJX73_05985 [bacterium]|nr:hypothetical protein [bacterium]
MRFKFAKSKYPIFKISFWVILISSIVLIFLIAKKNLHLFNISGNYAKNPVSFNVTFNRKIDENFLVCYGKYCKALENNSLVGNASGLSNIKSSVLDNEDENFADLEYENIYFAVPKETKNVENLIDKFDIFVNKKAYQYDVSEVVKFDNKTVKIALDDKKELKEYEVYTFKNLNSNVDFKIQNSILFLSLIKYLNFYIIPFVWLVVCAFIFLFNKDVFKIDTKKKVIILSGIILIYGLISSFLLFYLKANKSDVLANYIENDKNNYKNYKIEILKTDKKLDKIDKEKYEKNAILYFDSDMLNIDLASLSNAKMQILNANDKKLGKLIIK